MSTNSKNKIGFVRKPDVLKRFCISNSQLYKLIKEGKFPAPVKIENSSRWIESELDEKAEELISSTRSLDRRK